MWDIPWEPLSIPLLKKNRTQKLFGKGEKIKIQSARRESKPLIERKGKNQNHFIFAYIMNLKQKENKYTF